MMVCFPVNIPNRYITSVQVCTDRSTTDYIVDHVDGEIVYLDMVVPEEATIGGHYFKTDLAPLFPMGCQEVWKIQYNEERHHIPTWVSCQDDISVVFNDGFNLNSQDYSNIYLQISVHEYPIVYTDYPLAHRKIFNYQNGSDINISDMLLELNPGKRYVLSLATMCWNFNSGPLKVSSVVAKPNKVRTLIFDYEAEKTWTGQMFLDGPHDIWDNEFPGILAGINPDRFLTAINWQHTNPNAEYKYEIIKLNNDGTDHSTLYNSHFLPEAEFFGGANDHTFVFLNDDSRADGYFSNSTNEYFAVRVTTDDICDYTVRNVYFRTGDGSNLPPEDGNYDNGSTSRSVKGNPSISLNGNPGVILDFDYQNYSSDIARLVVFNNTGRKILSQKIEEGNIQIPDSSTWTSGLYYIIIKSGDKILTEKWIKQ